MFSQCKKRWLIRKVLVFFSILTFGLYFGLLGWLQFNFNIFWDGHSSYLFSADILLERVMLLDSSESKKPYASVFKPDGSRLPMCIFVEEEVVGNNFYGECETIYSGNRELCWKGIGYDSGCRSIRIHKSVWENNHLNQRFVNNVLRTCEYVVEFEAVEFSESEGIGEMPKKISSYDYPARSKSRYLSIAQENGCIGLFTHEIDSIYVEVFESDVNGVDPNLRIVETVLIDNMGIHNVKR